MTKANKLDFTLDQFTDEQRTALAGWYKHFTARYPVVGRLREYVASLNLLWPDVHTFEFWRSNPKCPIAKLYSGQQVAVLEKAIKRELRQQRLSILLRMDGIFLLSRRRPMDFVKFCRHWQKDPKIFEKLTLLCCGLISKTLAKRHLVSLTCLRGWEAAAFWPQGRHNAGTSCGRASHVPSWRQGNWVLFKCFLVLTWFHCFDSWNANNAGFAEFVILHTLQVSWVHLKFAKYIKINAWILNNWRMSGEVAWLGGQWTKWQDWYLAVLGGKHREVRDWNGWWGHSVHKHAHFLILLQLGRSLIVTGIE